MQIMDIGEEKENMKKRCVAMMLAGMMVISLAGCGSSDSGSSSKSARLDPDHPVSLTIWHYYNGAQQAMFDTLVKEFNATVGKDEGIYVEGYSQGSVSDLEQAVTSSLKGEVGAEELPDIFSSYADTAYAVQQEDKLADLSQYFTEDELSQYVDSYIQDGYFGNDGALYLLPVAKSTEITMINKTDWEPFAEATGTTLDELATVEGITQVAQRYYEWTDAQTPDVPDDGKAFYGRDSMSNYFIISMKQMGKEIFEVKDGGVTFNTDKDLIRRIWDNYYVPFVKGYFASLGKFHSDDVKTGDVLAYTGSTSSAVYFPDSVETEDSSYPIDYIECEAPVMEGGEKVKVQQGAGMAVTKSDEDHEYAASEFLKWFTQKEQNLRFVCESSYMPVLKEANSQEALDAVIKENNIEINSKVYDCFKIEMDSFDKFSFYTPRSFENGYSARKILDYSLSDKAKADKDAVNQAVAGGELKEEALAPYLTDDNFESWYQEFCDSLNAAVGK